MHIVVLPISVDWHCFPHRFLLSIHLTSAGVASSVHMTKEEPLDTASELDFPTDIPLSNITGKIPMKKMELLMGRRVLMNNPQLVR